MMIYSHCPECGYDQVRATNGLQTAIRKCADCGRFHCQECDAAKKMTSYRCPYCQSSNIQPYGIIRKSEIQIILTIT